MGDSIFPTGRTRSQLTLPEGLIELTRSPLKDARLASRNRSKMTMEGLGDKRSPSPMDQPQLKRFKSATESTATHSRHYSDSNILHHRSAPTSKPKSSSSSSNRQQSPALPQKARARSVPAFPSSQEFPLIDIRDIPSSPIRRVPKLRIKPISHLPTSQMLEAIPDAEQEARSTEPATPKTNTLAAPIGTLLSPLTPLPATPRLSKAAETADNRLTSGWGQDLFNTAGPPAIENSVAVKPARGLRSRLPRPTIPVASSSKSKPDAKPIQAPSNEPVTAAPKVSRNAFDVLMAGRPGKKGAKGKGKGKSSVEAETASLKPPTIKGKMKPRTKQIQSNPIPIVVEDEDERLSEPSNNSEAVAYPLETLPTQSSPVDMDVLPPKSSSPLFTPEPEPDGIEDGIMTMDGIEMGEDVKSETIPNGALEEATENLARFTSPLSEVTSAPSPLSCEVVHRKESLEPDTAFEKPSSLFSDVGHGSEFSQPSTLSRKKSSSSLFSEVGLEFEPDAASKKESTGSMDIPMNHSAVEPIPPAPKARKRRQKSSTRSPAVPRATRSASSIASSDERASKKVVGLRKAGKQAVSAVPSEEQALPASSPSLTSQTGPSAAGDESINADRAIFLDSSSELSDLPEGFDDVEMPLKVDSPLSTRKECSMVEPEVVSTNDLEKDGTATEKRRSSRTRNSIGKLAIDESAASFTVAPEQSKTSKGKAKAPSAARTSRIPKTPARSKSMIHDSPTNNTRPGSAPSSPKKPIAKSFTVNYTLNYIPVAPMINPQATALGKLAATNAILHAPPPLWVSKRRPNTSLGFNQDDPDSSMDFDEGHSMDMKVGKKPASSIGIGRPSTMSSMSGSSSSTQASSSKSTASFSHKSVLVLARRRRLVQLCMAEDQLVRSTCKTDSPVSGLGLRAREARKPARIRHWLLSLLVQSRAVETLLRKMTMIWRLRITIFSQMSLPPILMSPCQETRVIWISLSSSLAVARVKGKSMMKWSARGVER
ncbi:hypothetical protein BDP27DRAFT_1043077 [Rhodocollybia butyracea]|uniref:Uncharacterized protein n=1 Tax=Rhodocollybia butyracea TaxID=206335 RepID=A0A9P5Q6Q1_9AGAR|nr:hypothetical protein BDP27DRAFT_1043077 [Rhodocollybia butyracea]